MGRKPRKRPSLVSPNTRKELASLTGSMKATTARHLAEEQCAFECTRRRPRTPSPRKPVSTVFTRLAGEDVEGAGEDAVAAYLKRCNHVRVVGKCVVRRSVAFESPQVATLPRDQIVVVEEERLLGDERRVRLSAPCIGWVSRRCLVVSEDLLNERKLRTLVCVSGADLPLFEAWLKFYRRHHNASRELHVGFYDDEAYTYLPVRKSPSDLGIIAETFVYLLALQDDDQLNVVLHDTVIFPNVYERKEAQKRREKMRILQSAPVGSPVVYSSLEAFWIRDPLPDLLQHRRRVPPMLDDIRPQGRPCLLFSLDYGEIYEGEKNVELCTGFCCIFNEEASRKFLREWRSKVDATGAEGSFDQLQVNQMYKTWTASQKIRTVVELDYEDYQRCLRGKETWDVPIVWHPRCPVDPSTKRPYDASRRAAALTYVAKQLVKGHVGVIRAFHLCLEGGEDFASRKAMHLEATSGVLPSLTPEFALDPRTGRPRFRLRSSVKVPGPKRGPLVDSSGKLTGKVGFMDAASGASRRMRFQEKLDAKAHALHDKHAPPPVVRNAAIPSKR